MSEIEPITKYFLCVTMYRRHKASLLEREEYAMTTLYDMIMDTETPDIIRERLIPIVMRHQQEREVRLGGG
jgi:hypothetical protein